MKGPILITGTYRAGTTLISQIIRNHSDIELVYDSVNFMRFSYQRYNPVDNLNNVKKLLNETNNRINKRWNMNFDVDSVLKNIGEKNISYGKIYDNLMKELLIKDSQATIWGEKTTLVWSKIPYFFEMFPTGRVIHIIRDPRAVLASWRKMTHAPGNDYLDAILNCKDSMNQMKEYKIRFKKRNYAAVKFEDLVTAPQKELKQICDNLNLNYDPKMLNYDSFTNKQGNNWKGNSVFASKLKGISTKTIDKWKEKLQEWEIWLTQFINSELMKNFNYDLYSVNNEKSIANRVKKEIMKSQLVTEGILKYCLTGNGVERFPSDPLDSDNWENERK